MEEQKILLSGGNSTEVTRIGATVHRAAGEWTNAVHALLRHLEKVGFKAAPRVLGFDEQGREVLTFIEGEVGNYPLPHSLWSEEALIEAAKLLRQYHDATIGFEPPKGALWRFPAGYSGAHEVICHNDFAPYNCVYHNSLPVAIIDFDYASPGTRIWDIAYAVYRFVPISQEKEFWGNSQPNLERIYQRVHLFCDSYGLEKREYLLNVVCQRLELLKQMNLDRASNNPSEAKFYQAHANIYASNVAFVNQLIEVRLI